MIYRVGCILYDMQSLVYLVGCAELGGSLPLSLTMPYCPCLSLSLSFRHVGTVDD